MQTYKFTKKILPSGTRLYEIKELGIKSTSKSRDYVALMGTFDEDGLNAYVNHRFSRLDLIGKGDSRHLHGKPNTWIAYLDEETKAEDSPTPKAEEEEPTTKYVGEAPTTSHATSYQGLYDYLNTNLFGGELPNCILTMIPAVSKNGGHFWPNKWHDTDGAKLHEISMNPHGYAIHEPIVFVSIFAHEMAHLWVQENKETPPRGGYHCKFWGRKMKEIGLYPSNTGEPGGKETGQQMTHYIMEEGLFKEVFERMPEDLLLPFKRFKAPTVTRKKSKVKFSCPSCSANVWGKPETKVKCGECDEVMESEDSE